MSTDSTVSTDSPASAPRMQKATAPSPGPPPTARRGLPLWLRVLLAAAVPVAGALLAPELRNSTVHLVTEICIWACVAVSLHLVVGYAGQLSLASGAFLALGAYTGARATGFWGWPGLLTIAVVIFRARGLHFALLTAGISLVAYNVLINWSSATGGAGGMSTGGPLAEGGLPGALTLGPIEIRSADDFLVAVVTFLAVILLGVSVLMRRRTGESWKAIREDDVLAASVGVDVVRQKQVVFVLSSVLIALVGVIYAHWIGFVSPESFTFAQASFEPVAMIVIGGLGSLAGPVVGAVIVVGLPEYLRDAERFAVLIYGLLLLSVVMIAPRGVVGLLRSGASALVRAVRGRKGER